MRVSITRNNGHNGSRLAVVPFQRIAKFLLVTVFWLAVWQIISLCVHSEILVPGPVKVCRTWAGLMDSPRFWQACGFTILRVLGGFVGAGLVGTLLGVVCRYVRFLNWFITPILQMIRATPVISFILLALVWVYTDYVPVLISFLTVVPIFYAAVQSGLQTVNSDLLEMAKLFRVPKLKILKSVYLPAMIPSLVSQGAVGLGFAWKSGVAAEVICLPALSIGREMKNAKSVIDTPAVFAWTATVVLFSIFFEGLMRLATRKIKRRWHA